MFCPKCGSILLPKREDGRRVLACSCGFKTSKFESQTIKEKVASGAKKVEVIEKQDFENLPTMAVECDKCKNKEAYFWTVQTRAADEPETKFLRCKKCSNTWRDYD